MAGSRPSLTVCVWKAKDLIDMDRFPKDPLPDAYVSMCV
jgi:hypothetical protein